MSKRVSGRPGRRGSIFSSAVFRWTAATSILAGFGLAAFGAVGHISAGNPKLSRPDPQSVWRASLTPALGQAQAATGQGRSQYLFSRSTTFAMEKVAPVAPAPVLAARVQPKADPFDAVVRKAKLSPDGLAKAFKRTKPSPEPVKVASIEPAAERFGAIAAASRQPATSLALAYATPVESRAAQALHLLADEEEQTNRDLAGIPEGAEMPEAGPIPEMRPRIRISKAVREAVDEQEEKRVLRQAAIEERQETRPTELEKPAKVKPARKPLASRSRDLPNTEKSGGSGWSFRNIFSGSGGSRAGNGVAVYDISAAKVYMPDGTVLAAYSGIGKMANNPKYQHVKMNGPTPVHTYNLRMRERRFHGVEAIRMLPVDGKNKFGRDGFLTHSQLLRGRPGQSHGCVAFKDYDKFLNAFKKGKVKQMVVVASGGRAAATRVASR